MPLRSTEYDDIYFSPDDGMAESQYVYIDGNGLPKRFQKMGHRPFVVAELGFGAGLNFLLTVRSFLEHAPDSAQLHYFSVEKHPLPLAVIDEALAVFPLDDLRRALIGLLRNSSWIVPGYHTVFFHDRVRLTLMTGEAEQMLSSLGGGRVDAWFADGFAPSRNPAMWTDGVFEHVGRLSAQGTTIATFSSAGAVRRSMEKHGFTVEKVPGFGSKREMVVGTYRTVQEADQDSDLPPEQSSGHAIVIGGGLAGLMASLALLRRHWTVELRERLPGTGQASSGNPAGLFMPYLTAQPTTISRFTTRACESLISAFSAFGLSDLLHRTGIVRRIGVDGPDEQLLERIEKAIRSHGFPSSFIRRKGKTHFLIRKAGWTEPAALCRRLTEMLEERFGNRFQLTLNHHCNSLPEADAVIVASGTGLAQFAQTSYLPIKSVRGQLFTCNADKAKRYMNSGSRRPFVFENYIIPDEKGWVFGATFEPYLTDPERSEESDRRLLDQIEEQFPEIGAPMKADGFAPTDGRVGFRSQSKDYVPVIGPLPDYERSLERLKTDLLAELPVHQRIFVHGGFGSRGVMSSVLAAEVLVSHINREMHPVERDLVDELLPHRFLRREARSSR